MRIAASKPAKRVSDTFSQNLERENEHLQLIVNEMQTNLGESTMLNREKQNIIDELRERVQCLEDNLESKKLEVEEKNDAIETVQEKIQELTLELAMLRSAPEDASKYQRESRIS